MPQFRFTALSAFEFFAAIERYHTIQNPTSAEKLDLLGDYCRIGNGTRILDVGCGKAWLLRRWASRWAIRAVGLELIPAFAAEARAQAIAQGVDERIQIVEGPALTYAAAPSSFDVVLCIGASFALGDFESALPWMARYARPGGIVAIGEPFARELPFPESTRAQFGAMERSLAATVERLKSHKLSPIGLIEASVDDWDRYECLHWRAAHDWAAENPDHPDRAQMIDGKDMAQYLEFDRLYVGWAIFVAVNAQP
jgi:SAM-dependent methyltransferase